MRTHGSNNTKAMRGDSHGICSSCEVVSCWLVVDWDTAGRYLSIQPRSRAP